MIAEIISAVVSSGLNWDLVSVQKKNECLSLHQFDDIIETLCYKIETKRLKTDRTTSINTPILEIKKRIGDVQLKFNAIFNAEDEHYIKLRRIAITGDCGLNDRSSEYLFTPLSNAISEEKAKLDIFLLEALKAADEKFQSDTDVFTTISDTDAVI